MKRTLLFSAATLVCAATNAQVPFPCSDIPHQQGAYWRSYHSTNVNVSLILGEPGGPQVWDFSHPQQSIEDVWRTEIVSPDEPNPGAFPAADFAERDTREPNTPIAWRYYSITNEGRLYYGFNNPHDQPASSQIIFDEPTLDLPCPVQFGQNWSRMVYWNDEVLGLPVIYDFNAIAEVDAYGTIVLPNLGEQSALRVKELHNYEASYYFLGGWIPLVSQTNYFYYWLAPKAGVVAQVILFGENVLAPAPLSQTNLFLRVFEHSSLTNAPVTRPVAGLRILTQPGHAVLQWNAEPNAAHYRVEGIATLSSTNWDVVGQPLTNFWSEPLGPSQRFYRVSWTQQ